MSTNVVIVIVVVVAMLLVAALVARRRRANDTVDSFRRQIDALSPEARRPVVDQVQSVAGRQPSDADDGDGDDHGDDHGDDTDDEDGARGT